MSNKLVKNALGREVVTELNGEPAIPYMGIGKYRPEKQKHAPKIYSCADYPSDGNKQLKSIKEALKKSGLKDGMTLSTHHHFRNGDLIANMVFDAVKELGIKDIRWFPSASFPCHEHLIQYLEDGTIHHIEGSMNGPLGKYVSEGKMKGTGILRSHGGRYQAIQDGEIKLTLLLLELLQQILLEMQMAYLAIRHADCWVLPWLIHSMLIRLLLLLII